MSVGSLMIDALAAIYTFQPMEPLLGCIYGGGMLAEAPLPVEERHPQIHGQELPGHLTAPGADDARPHALRLLFVRTKSNQKIAGTGGSRPPSRGRPGAVIRHLGVFLRWCQYLEEQTAQPL